MIPQEIIEEVKRSADIVDIISEYVPGLRKNGANYKALSPFTNEKTASFIVSPEKQIFKDFSSGRGGSVFQFLQEYLSVSFPEAVEIVADKVGIQIPKSGISNADISKSEQMRRALEDVADFYHKNLFKNEKAFHYIRSRGFGDELVNTFQIGYSPDDWNSTYDFLKSKNYDDKLLEEVGIIKKTKHNTWYDYYRGRLIFPIRNKLGRTIAFGGRTLDKDTKAPKYLNTPQTFLYDKSKILFGLFEAKEEIRIKGSCILVEGYADVVSLYQAGVKNVVASSGTALTSGQLDLLKNYTNKIYLIYDADKAGINAAEKGLEIAIRIGFDALITRLPDGEDPDSIIQSQGRNTFYEYLNSSIDFVSFKKWVFEWKYGEMSATHRSELIRSLITLIKSIPDRFQHSHYIGRVQNELALSKLEKQYFEEELQKERNTKNGKLALKKNELEVSQKQSLNTLEIEDIEKYIFRYLIDNFSEFQEICDEFELSENNFLTEDARSIFYFLLEAPENVELFDYLENNEEIDFNEKNFIFDIALNREEINKKLAEEKSMEIITPRKYLEDCILKLKAVSWENELNELSKLLESNGERKILKRISELSQKLNDVRKTDE